LRWKAFIKKRCVVKLLFIVIFYFNFKYFRLKCLIVAYRMSRYLFFYHARIRYNWRKKKISQYLQYLNRLFLFYWNDHIHTTFSTVYKNPRSFLDSNDNLSSYLHFNGFVILFSFFRPWWNISHYSSLIFGQSNPRVKIAK
jgi:hypothetical protein